MVVLAVLLALGALPSLAQSVDIEVDQLFDPKNEIKLRVFPRGGTLVRIVEESRFDKTQAATADGLQINYEYDEPLLTPYPERKCYLQVWVVDPTAQQGIPEAQVSTWYRKFEMTVEGNFMDGAFELPIRVVVDGHPRSTVLTVVAHRMDPTAVLSFPGPPPPRVIRVPPLSQVLGVKNNSRVPIRLDAPKVIAEEPGLWASPPPSLKLDKALLDGLGENTMTLRATPALLPAFLRSFVSWEGASHATLEVQVPFEVRGGRADTISDRILVQFVPGPAFLVVGLLIGAALGVLVALAIRKERIKILRGAQSRRQLVGAVFARLGLAVGVAFVLFLLFRLIKGKIGFFDIELDPQTSASAFLIGFIVGTNPPFFYQWITERIRGKRQPPAAASLLGLMLLLGLISAPAGAVVPVSLAHESGSNVIYVLGSVNDVYRFDLPTKRWTKLKMPPVWGYMTDHCLVRQAAGTWLASVATQVIGSGGWRTTISLTALSPGLKSFRSVTVGFARPWAVTYDADGSRLLLADEERGGIYQVRVGPGGLSEERPFYQASQLREPISALVARGKLYVGDDSREAVFEVELGKPKARQIFKVEEPRGLALDANGTFLYVADSDDGVVLRYDLERGGAATPFAPEAPFEVPTAVAVDRSNHVWVADRGADVIFELDANGRLLGRYATP